MNILKLIIVFGLTILGTVILDIVFIANTELLYGNINSAGVVLPGMSKLLLLSLDYYVFPWITLLALIALVVYETLQSEKGKTVFATILLLNFELLYFAVFFWFGFAFYQ